MQAILACLVVLLAGCAVPEPAEGDEETGPPPFDGHAAQLTARESDQDRPTVAFADISNASDRRHVDRFMDAVAARGGTYEEEWGRDAARGLLQRLHADAGGEPSTNPVMVDRDGFLVLFAMLEVVEG